MRKLLIRGDYNSWYGTGVTSYNIVSEDIWGKLCGLADKDFEFWVHEWSGEYSENNIEVDGLFSIVTDNQEEIEAIEKVLGTHFGNLNLVDCVLERYAEYE